MSLSNKPSLIGRILHRNTSDEDTTSKSSTPPPEHSFKSDESLPPLPPVELKGYKPSTHHKLLDQELASNLRNLMPPRLQLFDDWNLIYSLDQHGISLNTLYGKSDVNNQIDEMKKGRAAQERGYGDLIVNDMINGSGPSSKSKVVGYSSSFSGYNRETKRPVGYVMVIRDNKNNRFGCYLNENLRPMDHKRYYGNGECFLWKLEKITKHEHRFKAFMYTGLNDNVIYSNHSFIAIGSSNGKNGLWINSNLEEGVSYRCDTFGNEILNGPGSHGDNADGDSEKVGKFKILGLELWRIGSLE